MAMPEKPALYIIQPGDQLDIKFFYNPELNENVTVRPDGLISLQLVDEVHASGLTPAQLDDLLTQKYSRELKKPMVTVIMRSFTMQRVYVGGEVNRQGESHGGMTPSRRFSRREVCETADLKRRSSSGRGRTGSLCR
jgi:protein involved in polysaccharide export with SLBB domain